MNELLKSILDKLQSLEDNYQIRDPGMVNFRQAKNEVQALIDTPVPAPEKVIVTEIATGTVADQVAAKINDTLAGLAQRMTAVEAATVNLLTPVQAANDKLDGMEDTLGAFIATHTDAPAEETPA